MQVELVTRAVAQLARVALAEELAAAVEVLMGFEECFASALVRGLSGRIAKLFRKSY